MCPSSYRFPAIETMNITWKEEEPAITGVPTNPAPETGERVLLMTGQGHEWQVTVPPTAKVTFGPFAPGGRGAGTVRVYGKTKEEVLAVFSGVDGFYDTSNVKLVDVTPKPSTPEPVEPVKPDDIPY